MIPFRKVADLTAWIAEGDNIEKYRAWLENEVTQVVLAGVQKENPVDTALASMITGSGGEAVAVAYGVAIGVDRVVRRICQLDEEPPIHVDPTSEYGARQIIASDGLTPDGEFDGGQYLDADENEE